MKKTKIQKKTVETKAGKKEMIVGRASVTEDLLDMIRRRCLMIPRVVKLLECAKVRIENASILMRDDGTIYWLHQGTESGFKIFVDEKLMPLKISGEEVAPPRDNHADLILASPFKGHIISIEMPRWG